MPLNDSSVYKSCWQDCPGTGRGFLAPPKLTDAHMVGPAKTYKLGLSEISGPQKGPAERGHVKKRHKSSKSVKNSVEPKVRLRGYGYNPFCSHSSRCLAVLV